MLERNPTLRPAELRAILMKTARDLGPPGQDDQFGAGEADAFAAVTAVSAPAIASVPERPAPPEVSAARTESSPAPSLEAEKPGPGEAQPETSERPALR